MEEYIWIMFDIQIHLLLWMFICAHPECAEIDKTKQSKNNKPIKQPSSPQPKSRGRG